MGKKDEQFTAAYKKQFALDWNAICKELKKHKEIKHIRLVDVNGRTELR